MELRINSTVKDAQKNITRNDDFIQSLINVTGNITENGVTIPTMLKFFNMWNEYGSETFWILNELVHENE